MDWDARTYLRLFLLVGGLIMLVWGITGDNTLNVLIGAGGLLLGAGGLVYEYRTAAE